mmetsp:Transcript_119238/g.178127  ORF Transcript_119238/g.178127 Transcript_119238/m.178127 type:complete len:121 (+) Transcript_119238:123-485(+)|eukprot:CAMPEP_0117035260 /NCGR_PEP_ID=MMETSP0472-20121206/25053_1 /TAXON_ID=693140 ORGANISM="Tiarina fusus, Strain LIS" /NCGR_SAMPLE_ID=MMETSP0472 /ASSEMBLY_ACC=CAM_ASM_000603 /LENGTH=120 /DNA_ID=CAMNT_0004744677 /DNA_START=123 /DNA_END=485 /DNA_ORIENTATION=+
MWKNDTEMGQTRKRTHEDGGTNASNQTPLHDPLKGFGSEDAHAEKIVSPYVNGSFPQEESHTRSLVKGFTWRLVATGTTVTITYFVTGEVGTALKIGFVEFFAKIMIYYAHERIWAKIRF